MSTNSTLPFPSSPSPFSTPLPAIVWGCFSSLLAGFSSGLTGFGGGIIFQLLWILGNSVGNIEGVGDLKTSVGVLTISFVISSCILGWESYRSHRESIIVSIILSLYPGFILFTYVGTFALVNTDQTILKDILGVFFLLVAIYQIGTRGWKEWKEWKGREEKRKETDMCNVMGEVEREIVEMGEMVKEMKGEDKGDNNNNINNNNSNNSHLLDAMNDNIPTDYVANTDPSNLVIIDSNPSPSPSSLQSNDEIHHSNNHHSQHDYHNDNIPNEKDTDKIHIDNKIETPHPITRQSKEISPTPSVSPPLPLSLSCQSLTLRNIYLYSFYHSRHLIPSNVSSQAFLLNYLSSPDTLPPLPPHLSSLHPSFTPSPSPSPSPPFLSLISLFLLHPFIPPILLIGCICGLLDGAFGTGGPPAMALFTVLRLTGTEIRSTWSVLSLVSVPNTIISNMIFGVFNVQYMALYCTIPIFTIIGNRTGSALHPHVNTQTIVLLLQILIILSTIPLTSPSFSGGNGMFGRVMAGIYVGLGGGMVAMGGWMGWKVWMGRKGRREREEREKNRKIEEENDVSVIPDDNGNLEHKQCDDPTTPSPPY